MRGVGEGERLRQQVDNAARQVFRAKYGRYSGRNMFLNTK